MFPWLPLLLLLLLELLLLLLLLLVYLLVLLPVYLLLLLLLLLPFLMPVPLLLLAWAPLARRSARALLSLSTVLSLPTPLGGDPAAVLSSRAELARQS